MGDTTSTRDTADTRKHDAFEPLLREVLGRRLRELRLARGERLVETAARAGISPQYLSEIERGLKEASSEMIAAITGALRITLVDLATDVVADLRGQTTAYDSGMHGGGSITELAPAHPDVVLYAVAA